MKSNEQKRVEKNIIEAALRICRGERQIERDKYHPRAPLEDARKDLTYYCNQFDGAGFTL